jgi:hypothetical protein
VQSLQPSPMLQSDLDARVVFPDATTLQGLVTLKYYPGQDPWVVHAGFYVANAEHKAQVERAVLMNAANILARAHWFGTAGAPLAFAVGPHYCRFRITDDQDGTTVDFDVNRQELIDFLEQTQALVDYPAEEAALTAALEQELWKL